MGLNVATIKPFIFALQQSFFLMNGIELLHLTNCYVR